MTRVCLPILVLLAACARTHPDETGDDTASWPPYPLDDVLRLDDLQAKGTHNSYHVETTPLDEWHYTHLSLDEQLEAQGSRQFELDVYWDEEAAHWSVYHASFIDEGTTCDTLVACLHTMKSWSDAHPRHHPLYTLVEVKEHYDPSTADAQLAALEAEVLSVWPVDRLVTPDLVQGDQPSVRDALATEGWPTLGAIRQRLLLVLHDNGSWRDAYTDDLTTTDGRVLFPDGYGDITLPIAAVHSMNNPYDTRIAEVVDAGHLVRTRADSDGEQARAEDGTQRDQALASGAHFVSTDFPMPLDWTSYYVEIPAGTPSRCNPRSAPASCSPEAIEEGVGSYEAPSTASRSAN